MHSYRNFSGKDNNSSEFVAFDIRAALLRRNTSYGLRGDSLQLEVIDTSTAGNYSMAS
jgi:hypothetical protein